MQYYLMKVDKLQCQWKQEMTIVCSLGSDPYCDWIILECDLRYPESIFSHYLQLFDFSDLPRVGSKLRACYALCDLIVHCENTVLEVTLGPLDLIYQYFSETTPQQELCDDFEKVLESSDSPLNEPKAVLISVGNGLQRGRTMGRIEWSHSIYTVEKMRREGSN